MPFRRATSHSYLSVKQTRRSLRVMSKHKSWSLGSYIGTLCCCCNSSVFWQKSSSSEGSQPEHWGVQHLTAASVSLWENQMYRDGHQVNGLLFIHWFTYLFLCIYIIYLLDKTFSDSIMLEDVLPACFLVNAPKLGLPFVFVSIGRNESTQTFSYLTFIISCMSLSLCIILKEQKYIRLSHIFILA